MERRRFLIGMGLLLIVAAFTWGVGQGWAQAPDLTKPNYANSPPLHKFVDGLPGLGAGNANNLGQYIPIAVPDTATFPGSDYYKIGLKDYSLKMHSDLPATKLRGYYQINGTDHSSQYLGPLILATKNRPVRVRFTNQLGVGAAGDLFIPVDTTIMGAGMGPDGTMYTQNRATLHLHGGLPPWISDGTAHQWITPAGETATLKRGYDVANVPDMPAPGLGSMNFFWTNQQSGRLMFFHDHAYGITRLNVYAGEAAGYLLVDPAEENALKAAGAPGTIGTTPDLAHLIPLVIQDKTFVADATTPTATDPTRWTTATDPLWAWGAGGSLWFPHVYMPNQVPPPGGGMNPLGRWDYGPWIFPPVKVTNANLPHPSIVPEAFMDTPVINGTAYPFVNVAPSAYRFRILNACNDRTLNLQLYVANASGKDVKMVLANGKTYPNVNQQPGEPATLAVPFDGRAGGVPDPTTAGPPIIQIGTEAGLLPAVAVLPNTPIDYDYDRRSITFGSVRNFPIANYPRVGYTLCLGPAERADVIIDFSQFAGKTLIMYNDAPAPFPGFDPRYDYYTNDPDQIAIGGAPSTTFGWGPNTRTLLQIRVGTGTPVPFNLAQLQAALPGIFKTYQPPAIVAPGVYGNTTLKNGDTFAGFKVHLKTINEAFDVAYGRMNATLGTGKSYINNQGLQAFGFDFVQPPTESIPEGGAAKPDGTQIWLLVHNGVDTHSIHFHLVNVQVVNRVDGAGVIKPPDPNELGWKETVRMNPLENVIVAVRPVKPTVPFKVPTCVRPLNVTMPPTGILGSTYDKISNPNPLWNFDWQYVWHCHLLGHEENDMMRPLILVTKPFAPSNAATTQPGGPASVRLTWTDNSKNETSFKVQRATDAAFKQNLSTFAVGPANGTPAKPKAFIGTTVKFIDNAVSPGVTYYYRVNATNNAGASAWASAPPITVQ